MTDKRAVAEIWGCGFNAFTQIDNSGDDIYSLQRIDSSRNYRETPVSTPHFVILWAGWADLFYYYYDEEQDSVAIHAYKANIASADFQKNVSSLVDSSIGLLTSAFGVETLMGVTGYPIPGPTTALIFQEEGECISLDTYWSIAVAGNGHVAALNGDGTQLLVFSSIKDIHPTSSDSKPLLKITISRTESMNPKLSPISSLSAGDAHFSFVVACTFPTNNPEDPSDMGLYYNNIWSIRTDSRSLDDSSIWTPLETELLTLPPFVSVEQSTTNGMPILCAHDDGNDESMQFIRTVSSGWMTAGLSSQGKVWIFPFGRAMMTIPNLPSLQVEEFSDVKDISLGNGHIAVLRGNDPEMEVWTFGLNDHGQRGFSSEDSKEGIENWRKLDVPTDATIKQVVCGRWNTFLVMERKITE